MRRTAPLLLAILASCSDDAAPPLPTGTLRLQRDGALRAGRVEVADPARLLAARATPQVEVEDETPVEHVARLIGYAADVRALELRTGQERLSVRLGPRPVAPPAVGPRPPPSDIPPVTTDELRVLTRRDRAEIVVRLMKPEAKRVREVVTESAAALALGSIVLVVEAPRGTAWGRVLPVVTEASAALGDRLVRHEIVAVP